MSPISLTSALLLTIHAGLPASAQDLSRSPDEIRVIDDRAVKGRIDSMLARPPAGVRLNSLDDMLKASPTGVGRVVLPSQSPSPSDGASLYRECVDSVLILAVRYKCGKCTRWHLRCCAAFAIADGLIATCHHALAKGGAQIAAVDYGGRLYAVKSVAASSPAQDLAILCVDGPRLKPLALARQPSGPGSEILVIHHPTSHFFVLTRGIVCRRSVERSKSYEGESLEITADFAKGSSGAPVLNTHGAVVGIARSTRLLRTSKSCASVQMVVHRAVPVKHLLALIRSSGTIEHGGRPASAGAKTD